MTAAQRVLLVGWSAADWRLLEPLLNAGALPHLARLIETGSSGSLRTIQPQLSPLLWTSIATGRRADAHGILNGVVVGEDGQLRPALGADRQCSALWDIAGSQGRRSVLVNWPLTYPAPRVEGTCAGDLFFHLAGTPQALSPAPPGSVYPPELTEIIGELRFSPAELSREEMAFFVPELAQAEAEDDPMLAQLAVALASAISAQATTLELLRETDWSLAMVRYDILESLGPPFMACYPPQLPYIPDKIFERYQDTIPAVIRYLDLMLGVLLELAGQDTLVMLFSERGIHSDHLRPMDAKTAFQQAGGLPWYREHGVVIVNGPGVKPGSRIAGANLLDIAPTALRALDLPAAADMAGRVLVEAFETLPDERRMASYDEPTASGREHREPTLSDEQAGRVLQHALDTGLLRPDDLEAPDAVARCRQQRDFNLAMVHLEARQPRRALDQLEFLHREHPDNLRIALHLARCRRQAGDADGARELLENVVEHADYPPYELMQLAQLHLTAGEHDQALLCLFRAEQAEGGRPAVHCQIGQVYLAMERWDEADRAFGKALERDADHAESHRGLAATRLGQGRNDEAIEAALRAIDLDRNQPRSHYLLGKGLLEKGDIEIAAQVFETCLVLSPNFEAAHLGLAEACERLGDTAEAAKHRQQARDIRNRATLARELQAVRQPLK